MYPRGISNSISSTTRFSSGSFGASSWLGNQIRGSLIVAYGEGAETLTTICSLDKASDLSKIINDTNDNWSIFFNCSDLAICLWNTVSSDTIGQDWIQTPANLWDKIEGKEYNVRGRNILGDRKRIGYYSNDQFVETIN